MDTYELDKELADLRDNLTMHEEYPDDFDPLDEDEQERLDALDALENEIGSPMADVRLIAESDFKEYAQELAEEIGIRDLGIWPMSCIDWEHAARELQHDYTSVEFDGTTYYYQAG